MTVALGVAIYYGQLVLFLFWKCHFGKKDVHRFEVENVVK